MTLPAKRTAYLLAVFLIAAILAAFIARPAQAAARGQENPPDTEFCLSCHMNPGQVKTLPSGEQLYISLDAVTFNNSIHAQIKMNCNACHPDITGYPHPAKTFTDRRDYTLQYKDTCAVCHGDKVHPDGMHQQLLDSGNKNALICADCHNPHEQPKLTDDSGQVVFIAKARIAQTCARCHSKIYDEYADSVHGAAAIGEDNPDVPVCTTCHGVHQIEDPTTAAFRLTSPRLDRKSVV